MYLCPRSKLIHKSLLSLHWKIKIETIFSFGDVIIPKERNEPANFRKASLRGLCAVENKGTLKRCFFSMKRKEEAEVIGVLSNSSCAQRQIDVSLLCFM